MGPPLETFLKIRKKKRKMRILKQSHSAEKLEMEDPTVPSGFVSYVKHTFPLAGPVVYSCVEKVSTTHTLLSDEKKTSHCKSRAFFPLKEKAPTGNTRTE